MTLIAQISDLHVQSAGALAYGIVDTNSLVQAAIAHLNQLNPQPDLVVATGDLVQQGTLADYQQLRELLANLRAPIYLMPGNHDDGANLQQVFADHHYLASSMNHLSYVVDDYPIRMIMLDNTLPGKKSGGLDDQRLAWLEAQLVRAPKAPTLMFMHHPPFVTGIPWMDRRRLGGSDALAALIAQHSQVERISCGHLHRVMYLRWAGTIASTQPSLVHQGFLDLQPDTASQFVMEPPAYQLHIWGNGSLVSHTVFVGNFDGPYRFSDGQKSNG
ncbi:MULTISPECIES: phosphodiesterase [Cyanophyceae]|uniref:phosphodiesterase n=1 Tax=Cyanophyceae TaxID=3028117 RepID=UPI001687FA5B|nr:MULTISPECIES: phosphodiesterase [Cyanophyceae]MBD1915449.1 phosphodiesterase [Phormidium sp. FACHB-77]MBD2028520.1 phosphodiesterase [Phormidium sp. FACHB-322]MBD2051060.1 phosphodiesterase [Leptolyngbya sp. FACHB-60]